jgi:SRSO17 transposase
MAGRFARVETRRRVRGFVLGLLADLPRKNRWTIAEHAGEADPHGMQYLLARASWDTDGVRDDLRDYVIAALGDLDAVLVFDETGDLKKGNCTVGVQRQYTGTAGRIENAQVAVYLTYAAAHGHALIDRELYLPQSWTGDARPARRVRGPADRLRTGHRLRPPRPHPGRPGPRRRPRRRPAPMGLAAALRRAGRQGRTVLQLGVDHSHPR